jgi:hypothetical protein
LDTWDRTAAEAALTLFARHKTGAGEPLARSAQQMAEMIVAALTKQTVQALLEAVIAEEVPGFDQPPETLARHVLMQRGLQGHRGLLRLDAAINVPVIGLGASASTYYPAVGEQVRAQMILPKHAGVANAIGAVVGRVTMRHTGTITSPSEGTFRVHLTDGPQDFATSAQALDRLEADLRQSAGDAARNAGAEDVQFTIGRDIRTAQAEAREVFVEAIVTVEASGRPRVAAG